MEGTIKQNPTEGMYPKRDSMVIAHNLMAMDTARQLGINNKKLRSNMERLSSGYKINRAADDAAGLAISEKMRRQIRGLDQGTRNMQDGVSWVQIGDGAMEEINTILNRMTELSVKGANGTLSASDREAIDAEIQQLKNEINRINETTKFNDIRIFSTDNSTQRELPEFTLKSFTGQPDDLDIFNATYDDATGDITYGGILFNGNRVSWNAIDPNMVYMDGNTQRFHEGSWSYTDAQGRRLNFSAREGDEVPIIKREFQIKANADGMLIDGELIDWSKIRNENGESARDTEHVNGTWTTNFHGMTMTFEIDRAYSGVLGMAEAINRGHDDGYSYKACARYTGSHPVQAVDADLTRNRIQVSRDLAEEINAGKNYILGADDTGLWLDVYDPLTDTRSTVVGSEKTWAELGITSWDSGNDIRADYGYYYRDDDGVNDRHIAFSFTLADVTSKDSVIDGLNGVAISCVNVWNDYDAEVQLDPAHSNVLSATLTDGNTISLQNELDLGRDFDDPTHEVGISPLDYDPAVSDQISLSYRGTSATDVITFTGTDAAVIADITSDMNDYVKYVIQKKVMTDLLGYDLGPKDLRDYLGASHITTSGKVSEEVVLDPSMPRSNGSGYSDPLTDGTAYGAARVDFSEIDTPKEIWELTGCGFDSTCNTCSRHYSFKFVLDTVGGASVDNVRYRIDTSDGMNPVMEVSVSSLIEKGIANAADPGAEIAKALVEVAKQGFDDHYQQYTAKDGVFYVFDERPEFNHNGEPARVSAEFYTTPYDASLDYRKEYTFALNSSDNGSEYLQYYYNHSGFDDRISVDKERDDANGQYVYNAATGLYEDAALHPTITERYNIKASYADASNHVDTSVTGLMTIGIAGSNITVNTEGNIDGVIAQYAVDAVKDMLDATNVRLAAKDFTTVALNGDEKPNVAFESLYEAYPESAHRTKPGEKMLESIRIQKSGDVPNCLRIPKFALNVGAIGLTEASCLTMDSSLNTIDMITYALRSVSQKRGTFGALQNRMEHAMRSNENVSENTTAAESLIRDTDMAKEMVSLTCTQLVSQAVQSMLSQANQTNQGVLSLLS